MPPQHSVPSHAMNISRFVAAYFIVRTVILTALFYFTQPSLQMDVLEHLAWGREWRMVYAQHPGLPAWINEAINILTGGSHLALSATSPVATTLAMWAVWTFARRIMDAPRAAIAALSLEGVYYFNAAAAEFSHNVAQLAACAWLFVAAHHAFLGGGKWRAWFALGAIAALSLYAKYSSPLFLAVLLLWSVAEPHAREKWKTAGPAVAFLICIALTLPQIIALANVDFAPLKYAAGRASSEGAWTDHIVYPFRFAAAQLGACVVAGVLYWCARTKSPAELSMSDAQRRFILVAAFGPLLLALLVSMFGGIKLRSLWGFAMLTFIPLWLLSQRPRELNWRRWRTGLMATAATVIIAIAAINLGKPLFLEKGKRIHYPGAAIAEKIEGEWRLRHPGSPLHYVVGETHVAALVSFYAPQRPRAVMYDGDWQKSFWASREEFAQTGGAVVYVIEDGRKSRSTLPEFAREYAEQTPPQTFSFAWDAPAEIPPIKIGVIFVPPKE